MAMTFISPLLPHPRRTRSLISPVVCTTGPSAPLVSASCSRKASTPPVVFVLGGPGSGKGTQCTILQQHFHVAQLCVGDLLRREVATGSDVGSTISEIMQRGDIVPGHVTMQLLDRELNAMSSSCSAVLIDGFPRAMDQALQFEQMVSPCEFVLYFKCDRAVMVDRLRHRAETSGRADDVEHVFRKRLSTFDRLTVPVIDYYRQGGLLREVDAGHGSIEEVYNRTKHHFEALLAE